MKGEIDNKVELSVYQLCIDIVFPIMNATK